MKGGNIKDLWYFAQGRVCITLTPVGLALKLPEAARGRLMKSGAGPSTTP